MKRRQRRGRTKAKHADRYELYEKAVQEPEADIALVQRVYRKQNGRAAHLLREDFCGTAYFACEWVKQSPENRAWAIDLDPVPLESGRRRHVAELRPDQAARIKLIEGNVLDVGHEKVDITAAFNFSYFLFRTRDAMRDYFERARDSLATDGILFLDAYGGGEAQMEQMEPRRVDGFTYEWDQHRFDPISHECVNYIHFSFPDGSRLQRAFRYDWRLWTLPEVRELLAEAGFRKSEVYWEGTDSDTGEGNGVFRPAAKASADPAWICYLAAFR